MFSNSLRLKSDKIIFLPKCLTNCQSEFLLKNTYIGSFGESHKMQLLYTFHLALQH